MNLKQYKKELIISSLVILLPIVFGLLLWNQLPDTMTTHWGVNGQADGHGSKSFAVFFMPLILLFTHWLCLWITSKDPGQKKQSKKAIGMIFWLMPMVSLFSSAVLYGTALGAEFNMASILFVMLGLMFMGIGNYMPKTKQNYTLGIKVVWTLCNEENWNATHRFAGKVWFIGGLVILLAAFFPMEYALWVMLPVIFALALVPMLYSYLYYKKQCARGEGYPLTYVHKDPAMEKIARWAYVVLAIVLIFVFLVLFIGEINCVFNTDSFTIEASFYDDLTVEYAAIDSIELRTESVPGTREWGLGSARLLLGTFKNEEFGFYTRYTYTNCKTAIVLTVQGKTLVLAEKDPDKTVELYNTLLSHMEG